MSRLRVLDIAKELKLDTKTVIVKLNDLGIQVKNHFNAISDIEADKLRSYLRSGRNPEKEAAAKPASKVVIRRRTDAAPSAEAGAREDAPQAAEFSAEPAAVESFQPADVETVAVAAPQSFEPPAVPEVREEPASPSPASSSKPAIDSEQTSIQAQSQTTKEAKPPVAAAPATSTGSSSATVVRPAGPALSATIIRRADVAPASSAGPTASSGPRPYGSGPIPAGGRPTPRDG